MDGKTTSTFVRFDEEHKTPAEIAALWGLDVKTIRNLFRKEEGVLMYGRKGGRGRRGYSTIRIPVSVAERVHRRMLNKGAA